MKRLEIKIFGDVQGVGFRAFAYYRAQEFGLVGSAENLADGSLFVVAEGEKGKLEQFLSELTKGPTYAKVEKVEEVWGKSEGTFKDFEVF